MPQQVQFRRIRGRVVPIRQKKAEGAAYVAAGVGVAAIAGHTAGALQKDAAKFKSVASGYRTKARNLYKKAALARTGDQLHLDQPLHTRRAAQMVHQAGKNMGSAAQLIVAGRNIRRAGLVAGATLIGVGTHKLLPKDVKKNPKTAKAIAATSGVASAFVIHSAYTRRLTGKGLFNAFKQATVRVATKGIKI